MVQGLLARKIGMTQVFNAQGELVPVTVVQAGPCVVVERRTSERDGYEAAQVGLVEGKPPRKVTKARAGQFAKSNVPPTRVLCEVPVEAGSATKPGDTVLCDIFAADEVIRVVGTSKGKGFQGAMVRHNFRGGGAAHGSMFHRAPGSIGASSFPSRVVKGMRAAGRMGGSQVTTRNLRVVSVDIDNHLLVLRGAVPGAPDGVVVVRRAIARKPDPQPQVEKPKKGKK